MAGCCGNRFIKQQGGFKLAIIHHKTERVTAGMILDIKVSG